MAKTNRPKPPTNYDFESNNQKYDFTKICRDMQHSTVWKQLNLRQQRFIFTFKIKIYCKFKNINK